MFYLIIYLPTFALWDHRLNQIDQKSGLSDFTSKMKDSAVVAVT